MITIVSGLPRSGTSLMMQMLAAGGMPVLSDGERKADTDNPKGYLEWERIKQLPKDPSLIAEAEGKVVKVISQLILSLPDGHEYRIIFMQRPMPEVLKSQEEMLQRRGTYEPGGNSSQMAELFQRHVIEVNKAPTSAESAICSRSISRISHGHTSAPRSKWRKSISPWPGVLTRRYQSPPGVPVSTTSPSTGESTRRSEE